MKAKPLDDLEMFDLLRAAYPEKFQNDDDQTYDEALNFANEIEGFDAVADLLGRVAMLTMPMQSGLSQTRYHCLGAVTFVGDRAQMTAAVRREVV